jgi:hypothetical protein
MVAIFGYSSLRSQFTVQLPQPNPNHCSIQTGLQLQRMALVRQLMEIKTNYSNFNYNEL